MNESILLEAAKQILHLHLCEQEGLQSGKPTPQQWYEAVDNLSEAIKKWEDSSGKETGMRGWRKYNDLPDEAGLYVCECKKKGNGETSQTVTYGQYIKGFPFIKVDEEKFGKVIRWLDESVPPYKEEVDKEKKA